MLIFLQFIEFIGIIGMSAAGAACLWGGFYSFRARRNHAEDRALAERCVLAAFFGIFLMVFAWLLFAIFIPEESAAALSLLAFEIERYKTLFTFQFYLLVFLAIVSTIGVAIFKKKKRVSAAKLEMLFFILGAPVFFYASIGTDGFGILSAFKNLALILSFGTMLISMHLYAHTYRLMEERALLREHLFRFWPVMWTGVGLLTIIDILRLSSHAFFTPHFLFSQFLLGIFIMSLALASGPFSQVLHESHPLHRGATITPIVKRLIMILTSVSFTSIFTFIGIQTVSSILLTDVEYALLYVSFFTATLIIFYLFQDLYLDKKLIAPL